MPIPDEERRIHAAGGTLENAKSVIKGSKDCRGQKCRSSSPLLFQKSAIIWMLCCVLLQSSFMTGALSPPLHRTIAFRYATSLFYSWIVNDASNEGAVDGYLRDRFVMFHSKATQTSKPLPSFDEVWELLRNELPEGGILLPSAESALKNLAVVMNEEYCCELAFDEAMFMTMNKFLAPYTTQQDDPDVLVLNLGGETQEYAAGIARQTFLTQYDASDTDLDVPIPVHTVCLFHSEGNDWSVTDCFSVVGIRTSDSTCEKFDFCDITGKMIAPHFALKAHLALGHVILFNLWFVLTSQAKRGVLADQIPLAVVAAKLKHLKEQVQHRQADDNDSKLQHPPFSNHAMLERMLRWVSGNLEVSQACGGNFHYSVQAFGSFLDSINEEEDSVERAATLYINIMLTGLLAAIQVQKRLAGGEVPLAVPASGQVLMIGDQTLELEFWASPYPGQLQV